MGRWVVAEPTILLVMLPGSALRSLCGILSVTSVVNQDEPVIIAVVPLAAVFVVLANIVVDLLYAVLDPRVGST